MELNLKGLKMCKWNILTDKDQRADEKNWVIYLVITLIPELWSLKCQKWLIFCIFSWWYQEVTVLAKYLNALGTSYWVLSENDMVNRLLSYRSWNIKSRNRKKLLNQQKLPNKFFFKFWHLPKGTSESNNP